jgi:hypothetical protein
MAGGIKIMSRKTFLAIVAVVGAILTFLNEQFTLGLDTTALVAVITTIGVWIFFEARLDIKRIIGQVAEQTGKFKDPRFWSALIIALLEVMNEILGWNIPIEIVAGVLVVILGFLFKKEGDKVTNGGIA